MAEKNSNDGNFDLGELLEAEIDDVKDEDQQTLEELKEQMAELEKEKKGLLAATKEERKKRQDIAAKLNQLEGAVGSILAQRQRDDQVLDDISKGDSSNKTAIPVEYDEDGNAWVDPKALEPVFTPYQQKIMELEQQLQLTNNTQNAVLEAEKVKQSIIGENERYQTAAGKYRAARKWVEDQVIDFSKTNGINRPMNSGEALDYVFDDNLRAEFEEKFGKIDLVDVVTAEDSKLLFRRALDNIANTMSDTDMTTTPKEKMDSRFQKVLNKPSALGNQQNAKSGQLSIMDKIESLSSLDIMDLTDEQVEALQRAAGREEKEDGIKF